MNQSADKTILVVNNDQRFLDDILQLLGDHGHQVHCAADVFTFLDIIVDLTPDVIFLDLIFPKIQGDDLCRIIRNTKHLKTCYLVIISEATSEYPLDFRAVGADTCIAKAPFADMADNVLKAIENSESTRQDAVIPEIIGIPSLHSRRVTKELLQQNKHLKVILDSMSQGILELERNRIVYANPQAVKLLGSSRSSLLGSEALLSIPQQLLAAISDDHSENSSIPSGRSPVEIRLFDRQVAVEHFPIHVDDNSSRIVMISDITEHKQMESVIEATNLTEKLGYVFSGIRHEIGNPLNSIKMALSVLQRHLGEYDIETIAEFLDRSLQEVSRIEYLLKALKNYSLFEKPVMQKISAARFLEDFTALIRDDFSQKNIRIHTVISENDITVWADSRALHHIMLNLVTNAADALQETDLPKIVIKVTRNDDWVEIKIDDNGHGISEADQQNLFKPFFTSKTTGTGLGLVIVRKMLAAMHSHIAVESYQDIGTTVTVTLPGNENVWSKN